MAQRYRMTARRRAALKKAQIASAKKRSRNKKIKRVAVGGALAGAVVGGAVARHKLSGSEFRTVHHPIVSKHSGNLIGPSAGRRFNSPITHNNNANRKRVVTGRSIGYTTARKGPLGDSKTVSYEHKKLTRTVIGNRIGDQIGKSPRATSTVNRLDYKTRALRKKGNIYAAEYRPKSGLNYGSYGKRLPSLVPTKTRGGVKVGSSVPQYAAQYGRDE